MTRKDARQRAHEAAVRSGDRAYVYRETGAGLEEVRVWPNGDTTYTKVDQAGRAQAGPKRALLREGGWRNNVRVPGPTLAIVLGFAALFVEHLF